MSKILVVDDNFEILKLVQTSLNRVGFSVTTTSSGYDALELIEIEDFDLVILDIMMPVMDGHELFKRIKDNPRFHEVPVIFLSAKTGVNNRILGYKLGAVHYLEKPFEQEELRSVCKALTNRPKIDKKEDFVILEDRRTLVVGEIEVAFTPVQFVLLKVILGSKGRVISKEEMCEAASSVKKIKIRNLEPHITALRRKLGPLNMTIENQYGDGYRLVFENKDLADNAA